MKDYITLTTHKKCIGQYNFQPLLYLKNSNGQLSSVYGYYLPNPGKYTITYISGGIKTHDLKKINSFLPSANQLSSDFELRWNKYYETSAISLGNYDISYFPTSSILFGCFQCQYGTLPGFTSDGFFTENMTQAFNNNYPYQSFSFTIDTPQYLNFWYTDILEQTTEGMITYSIEYEGIADNLYYFNDISVLAIDKLTKTKLTYENYLYNKNKQNLLANQISKTKNIWITNTSTQIDIQSIVSFNTVGYNDAYLNDIKYTDINNYEKTYSQIYHWQLLKENDNQQYVFIGKFNNKSKTLLLYRNSYTMIINQPAYYNNKNIFTDYNPQKWNNDKIINKSYQFSIQSYDFIEFNKILEDNIDIYLYLNYVTPSQVANYIKNVKKQLNSLNEIPIILNSTEDTNYSTILSFNENGYNYYIDLSLYLENISSFILYTDKIPSNNNSIGPYFTKETALSSLKTNIAETYNIPITNIILSTANENIFDKYKYSALYDIVIKES